jgi:hypothetical protein
VSIPKSDKLLALSAPVNAIKMTTRFAATIAAIIAAMIEVKTLRTLHLPPPTAVGAGAPAAPPHISAASGLVQLGQRLFVVADDETHLAQFDLLDDGPGQLFALTQVALPHGDEARKAAKPDLETLTWLPATPGHPQGRLLALGSGSGPRRQQAVVLRLDAQHQPMPQASMVDLQPLYAALQTEFGGLNIEGAFVDGSALCLLQRGSRRWPVNACIRFDLTDFVRWLDGAGAAPQATAIQTFDLGHLAGVPLCFTDGAALPGGGWAFAAAAEDTLDSYSDGRCMGSVLGVVDAHGRLQHSAPLALVCKAEGIAVSMQAGQLQALLVTDADDRALPALLLSAALPTSMGI